MISGTVPEVGRRGLDSGNGPSEENPLALSQTGTAGNRAWAGGTPASMVALSDGWSPVLDHPVVVLFSTVGSVIANRTRTDADTVCCCGSTSSSIAETSA